MAVSFIQKSPTFIVLWLVAIGTGFAIFLNYQNAGGQTGSIPSHWPKESQIPLAATGHTLVMFAHPQCPCTRASIAELNRLLARISDTTSAQVWFYQPAKVPATWSKTDLWQSTVAIPGITVREDWDGKQAHLFGVETSGTVLLYDSHGNLLFKGGITAARGHAGDNPGESDIVSLCLGQRADTNQTPIFGCSLLGQCENRAINGGGE